jgi:hypothetical protein
LTGEEDDDHQQTDEEADAHPGFVAGNKSSNGNQDSENELRCCREPARGDLIECDARVAGVSAAPTEVLLSVTS